MNQLLHGSCFDEVDMCLLTVREAKEQVGDEHFGEDVDGGTVKSKLE